jgi:hypothetical protein
MAALSMPLTMASVAIVQWMATLPLPKFDLYLFRIDGVLGFQPSFLLGQFVQRHLWLLILAEIGYGALTCVVVVVFGFYLWRCPKAETLKLLRTFILNLFLAVPFYLLIPVCGPRFAFHDFPFSPPLHMIPHAIAIAAPPNGVPSVHASTAFLIVWFSWRWKVGRVFSLAYLVLTVIATLGSGQHYLFDLIVAAPYAALMLYLGSFKWYKRKNLEEARNALPSQLTSA